jgi:hypothetical protein
MQKEGNTNGLNHTSKSTNIKRKKTKKGKI